MGSKIILKYFSLILLLFVTKYLLAQQEPGTKQTLEDLIEDIASNSDEEIDFTSLYDDLNYFLNNLLKLN